MIDTTDGGKAVYIVNLSKVNGSNNYHYVIAYKSA